jgi:hypothetical protein
MSAYNHNAGVAYLQLFNLATHPTPGAVPDYLWLVPGKGNLILSSDYLAGGLGGYGVGLWFGSGISWGLSITFASYTAATAADCYVEARYY